MAEGFGAGNLGDPGAGAVSSYQIEPDGSLQVISESIGNGETATCWIVPDSRGRFFYVSNNVSGTISSYRVARDGSLILRQAIAGEGELNRTKPVDLAMTRNGGFLYSLNAGTGTISMFRVNRSNGGLIPLGEIGGLPVNDGAFGMAIADFRARRGDDDDD